MKIAIYKPYKTIHWNDMSKDTNVWSREVKNFALMMRDNGHECHLLSKTDYQDGQEENIFIGDLQPQEEYDVLVVFNGAFSENEIEEIQLLNSIAARKTVLIASDLDLAKQEHKAYLYTHVLTCTKNASFGQHTEYGAVQDYHMYKEEMYKGGWDIRKNEGIFIGHDRHKQELFLEYVMRPNMNFYGKAFGLNINKIIPRDEAYSLLRRYAYSIVFFDKRVTDIGFVTARPLELMLKGVIPFIDVAYDKYNLQFDRNHPIEKQLFVDGYVDFMQAVDKLNKEKFIELQEHCFNKMQDIIACKTAYKLFMDVVQ